MLINNYVHSKGKNCESSTQKNVLDYYGMKLEEEVIFGLDGGFGLMFYKNTNDKIDILVGKNEIFPKKALKMLGVKLNGISSLTGDAGWKVLKKEYLDQNKPVIVRVDTGFLPYWKTPKEAYFGGYFVVLCGYENDGEYLYVSDCEFDELQKLTIKELSEARSSKKSPPINPNNDMYFISEPKNVPDLSKVGPVALRSTVRNFLSFSILNTGLKGLKAFHKCMQEWPQVKVGSITEIQHDGSTSIFPTLNFQIQQTGRYIEILGTGGGCYRKMFSDFLSALYNATNNNIFKTSSELISQSAELWGEIGQSFLNVDHSTTKEEIEDKINKAATQVESIIAYEKNAFEIIRRV